MGLEQEFLENVDMHARLIHKVCNLYMDSEADREDLFQEIVANAWKSYGGFRRESRFSTWLYRVALNTAISTFRKRKVRRGFDPHEFMRVGEQTEDPYAREVAALDLAISRLSKVDKALVALYLDDLSYEEMAQILGISVSNVGVKLNRLRRRLKDECARILSSNNE